jgi:DNA-directed RNA polymerase subunit D
MKIKKLQDEENKVVFTLKSKPILANVLRRYVLARIPVLAIDEVIIYSNTSAIFDEYIAHRLGQLPITTPENLPKDVEFQFYLNVAGPKVVYAKELKSNDADVKVGRPKIPIITLGEKEELRLEGIARVGTAQQHAKFQCAVCSYEIKDDGNVEFFVESCSQMPPKVILKKAIEQIKKDIQELKNAIG